MLASSITQVTNDRNRVNVLDTYVHPGDSISHNHVNEDRMYIGKINGESRAFVNWNNLPSINGTITGGFLSFTFFPGTTTWGGVDVQRVADSWNSNTLTWDIQNNLKTDWLYSWLEPRDWKGYKNFDVNVTDTIQGWYNQNGKRYGRNGFYIKHSVEVNDYNTIISSDSGYASELWPCIYINYEPNASDSTPKSYEDLNWQYPLNEMYTAITNNYSSNHPAVDIATKSGQESIDGQPIMAAQSGQIIWAGWSKSGGNMISIRSDSYDPTTNRQIIYNYMHMKYSALKNSGRVTKGEIIGYVGNTGISTGSHLHFEIYAPISLNLSSLGATNYPGQTIDPKLFYGCI